MAIKYPFNSFEKTYNRLGAKGTSQTTGEFQTNLARIQPFGVDDFSRDSQNIYMEELKGGKDILKAVNQDRYAQMFSEFQKFEELNINEFDNEKDFKEAFLDKYNKQKNISDLFVKRMWDFNHTPKRIGGGEAPKRKVEKVTIDNVNMLIPSRYKPKAKKKAFARATLQEEIFSLVNIKTGERELVMKSFNKKLGRNVFNEVASGQFRSNPLK